ncbi:hypothetical protein K504DRAFT_451904 [Pleomassaria siparia CBS 279.74]|uniref:Rhodopsin domain-containing protein n=1 Tax=Pleomassaria siparia CBS 279.74 TaxID=1314801 RepID=A0A6G1JRL8_9PLEO|nr:hypothetical protein K504DRAFT_451904 [Pleomassaria siparia CBS 279.74]
MGLLVLHNTSLIPSYPPSRDREERRGERQRERRREREKESRHSPATQQAGNLHVLPRINMPYTNAIFAELLKNPPDPNGPIPLANRPSTMYGTVLPFHIIAWIAVISRLYTRFRIVREPGWDDYTIIMAALTNVVCMVGYIGGIETGGMGNHLIYLTEDQFAVTMKWLYLVSGGYSLTTTLVKVSVLCQYLRLFQKDAKLRLICIVLLVLATFISLAATNMAFDIAIFLVPTAEYIKLGLGRKQVLALTGLFTLGSVVVLMAVLRLWTAVRNNKATLSSMDFTWWYPLTLILSCIELDLSIICGSIPIFWPNMVVFLAHIFVVNEVHVTNHLRLDDEGVERGHYGAEDFELGASMDWDAGRSRENLTRGPSASESGNGKTDYSDQFVVDHVTGKVQDRTYVQVGHVQKKKKKKKEKKGWREFMS